MHANVALHCTLPCLIFSQSSPSQLFTFICTTTNRNTSCFVLISEVVIFTNINSHLLHTLIIL